MSRYSLSWITSYLAVGSAPMSYEDLDCIKTQGINGIVNLCGEFCDLHQIESDSGFEVYYLPIQDECVPDLERMEKALAWLDEAVYLGKKILVHCRHGIGRTGTFVTAYLIRRGLALNTASEKLKKTTAKPANYEQWRLIKKYGNRTGELTIRAPMLESANVVDLSLFFAEYEAVIRELSHEVELLKGDDVQWCGQNSDTCCHENFEVGLIEAVYISHYMNKHLHADQRIEIIQNALQARRDSKANGTKTSSNDSKVMLCPLSHEKKCLLFEQRPLRCRIAGITSASAQRIEMTQEMVFNVSKSLFLALSGNFLKKDQMQFPILDVLSGKYMEHYFHTLISA